MGIQTIAWCRWIYCVRARQVSTRQSGGYFVLPKMLQVDDKTHAIQVLCVQLKCTSYSRPKKSSRAQAALKTTSNWPSAESPDKICSREKVEQRGMFLDGPHLPVATASNHLVPPGLKASGPRLFSHGSCPQQVASELRLLQQASTGAHSFPVLAGVPSGSYQPVRGRGRTTSLRRHQQREPYQSDLILNDCDRSLPGVLDAFSNNRSALDLQRSLSSNHLQLDREVRRLITSSSSRNHQFIIEGARDDLQTQALRLELEGCREDLRNVQNGLITFNRLNTR